MARLSKPKAERKPTSKGAEADPAQYQRFLDAARELGCKEPERMDGVVKRAAKMSPPRKAETSGD